MNGKHDNTKERKQKKKNEIETNNGREENNKNTMAGIV